ncbi:putative reverse transcriptase domain-containing protein [Tanacetum coccineum]
MHAPSGRKFDSLPSLWNFMSMQILYRVDGGDFMRYVEEFEIVLDRIGKASPVFVQILIGMLCQSLKWVDSILNMNGKGCEFFPLNLSIAHVRSSRENAAKGMRTPNAGRPAAESLGGGMGKRVGRGRRGRRPREGNDDNLLPDMLAQVGNQGNVGNQNGNVVNENVQENFRNVLVNGNRVGCSYKEFLACDPKEYNGKGGVVVLTRRIEKMKFVQDMSGCSIDQKVKYTTGSLMEEFCPSHEMQKLETELWNHAMVGAGHAAYTDRFHELARLVPHLVTPKSRKIERYVYGLAPQIRGMVAATEPKTIQKAVQISGALTDEAVRNGSIKKVEKRGNVGEPSKDKNGRDDNKRTRTGNAFATTANPVGRENTGAWPKCTTCNSYHAPGGPCRTCFNCNRPGHLAKDCRGVPRNVNPVNARNPTVRACYECGSTDHVRSACPRLNRAQGPEGMNFLHIIANVSHMD